MTKIGFTGHRTCRTLWAELYQLYDEFPGAVWVWGAARDGFDLQVGQFILLHNVTHASLPAGVNPKLRNTKIVEAGIEFLVACHDGREYGGTWDTMQKAVARNIPIRTVTCIPIIRPYSLVR